MMEEPSDERWIHLEERLTSHPHPARCLDSMPLVLHEACSSNAPLSLIKLLVETRPSLTAHQDEQGRLPLHLACKNASLEVIEYLLAYWSVWVDERLPEEVLHLLTSYYPSNVNSPDNRGFLPLHYTISGKAPYLVIERLFRVTDAALSVPNNGDSIFHFAARIPAHAQVLKLLHEKHPIPVNEARCNQEEKTTLHLAFESGASLETIEFLLESDPQMVVERDDNWATPIHLAVKGHAPVPLIQRLLDTCAAVVNPSVASQAALCTRVFRWAVGGIPPPHIVEYHGRTRPDPDDDGNNFSLLHHACIHGAPVPVLQTLMEHWPDLIHGQTSPGWTPLFHACWRRRADGDVVAYLIRQWPDSVRAVDDYGQIALHVLVRAGESPLEACQAYIDAWPESLRATDHDGDLPLHVACFWGTVSYALVLKLTLYWPESVRVTNRLGQTPLHCACLHHESLVNRYTIIALLLLQYPDAVRVRDTSSYQATPLHYACQHRLSLSIIQKLVNVWPDSIHAQDRRGRTPLFYAERPSDVARDVSPDVVAFLSSMMNPISQE